MTEQTLDRGDPETLFRFQVGEPVEHRGIVVAPLFPLRDPVARYATLDEALERGFEITETEPAGPCPSSPSPTRSTMPCCSTTARSSSGRSRTASSTSACSSPRARSSRSPCRASSRAGGAPSRRSSPPRATSRTPSCGARRPTRSRPAAALAARRRARSGARCTRSSTGWRLPRRPRRTTTPSPPTGGRSRASRLPSRPAGAVRCRPRPRGRALPRRRLASGCLRAPCGPSCAPGTCSTRSSSWTRARPRPERIHGFVDEVGQAPAERSPAAGLGVDVRLRGPGVLGAGLELDGELIQLSAFTIEADRPARGRIARPSRRSA